MKYLIKTFLFISIIFAQYPADTLLILPSTSKIERMLISPISKWQRISYGSPEMNCQFFPSCSQYGAIAINKKGPILGLFATSDRIIRCNPSAMKTHSMIGGGFYQDGRIIDMLKPEYINDEKSPVVAGILSIVPGLGRIYSKKYTDGLFGFLLTSVAYQTAIRSNKKNSILAPFFISAAVVLHGGEIYGSYRSAKYYNSKKISY
tara:strand:- start:131 stop:745 length:615 start_codon:yes stop_codon:yes gene_type:complete